MFLCLGDKLNMVYILVILKKMRYISDDVLSDKCLSCSVYV